MVKRARSSVKSQSEWTAFGLAFLVALGFVWLISNYPAERPSSYVQRQPSGPFFAPTPEFLEHNVLRVDGTTITIGRDCLAIVADTSEERAEGILSGLGNKTGERPNAWDGWSSALDAFNITFEATTLYGKTGSAYLSRAIFRQGNAVLDLDMRPSDAMALALRTDTPIYINMTLLREDGENVC